MPTGRPVALGVKFPQWEWLQQSKLSWALAAILAIIAVAAIAPWWRATRPSDRPLVRLDVDLGPDVRLGGAYPEVEVILSPDGSRIVFVSGNRLFTRRLINPTPLN